MGVLLAAKATVNTQNKVSFNTFFPHQCYAFYIVFLLYVQSGETPLYVACFEGHQKCVELLIDAGANVDVPDEVSVARREGLETKVYSRLNNSVANAV